MNNTNDGEQIVIGLHNVTMDFRIAQGGEGGLKNFIVQGLRGRVKYINLRALNDISFSVKKGEVVGLIGTNGSGKSTLLKCITGVFIPTSGSIDIEFGSVRLLTLGSGFDPELSGRENVYLNGSIIGLSRDYLDRHYKQIVEFAELDGFMEEKVRNYSSGMEARLAFSIATVGSSPEILLLDEVLSVGDTFFQDKCIRRIKEIIDNGATVIMVSHNMDTIIRYCTRAIWIEKGILKMDGAPEEVCGEYIAG